MSRNASCSGFSLSFGTGTPFSVTCSQHTNQQTTTHTWSCPPPTSNACRCPSWLDRGQPVSQMPCSNRAVTRVTHLDLHPAIACCNPGQDAPQCHRSDIQPGHIRKQAQGMACRVCGGLNPGLQAAHQQWQIVSARRSAAHKAATSHKTQGEATGVHRCAAASCGTAAACVSLTMPSASPGDMNLDV